MKILIVEDDSSKKEKVETHLLELLDDPTIEWRRSRGSALRALLLEDDAYDLVVLDMSLPDFDVSESESGGQLRPFAGWEILKRLRRRGVATKVVVVTQLDAFGRGGKRVTLEDLVDKLEREFPRLFVGHVFFNPAFDEWKQSLAATLQSQSWTENS